MLLKLGIMFCLSIAFCMFISVDLCNFSVFSLTMYSMHRYITIYLSLVFDGISSSFHLLMMVLWCTFFHVSVCVCTCGLAYIPRAMHTLSNVDCVQMLSTVCVCVCVSHSVVVWLFATPQTVAREASLSMEFSRQDYCSGLPFPSPEDLPDPGMEPWSPALLLFHSVALLTCFFPTMGWELPLLRVLSSTWCGQTF